MSAVSGLSRLHALDPMHISDTFINTGCGDLSDVAANSPGLGEETDCDIPCSGDPIHLCGGAQRLQVYPPMNS